MTAVRFARCVSFLLVVGALQVSACGGLPSEPPAPPIAPHQIPTLPQQTMKGRILDRWGDPFPDAWVSHFGNAATRTDAQGWFLLPNVALPTDLFISHDGYAYGLKTVFTGITTLEPIFVVAAGRHRGESTAYLQGSVELVSTPVAEGNLVNLTAYFLAEGSSDMFSGSPVHPSTTQIDGTVKLIGTEARRGGVLVIQSEVTSFNQFIRYLGYHWRDDILVTPGQELDFGKLELIPLDAKSLPLTLQAFDDFDHVSLKLTMTLPGVAPIFLNSPVGTFDGRATFEIPHVAGAKFQIHAWASQPEWGPTVEAASTEFDSQVTAVTLSLPNTVQLLTPASGATVPRTAVLRWSSPFPHAICSTVVRSLDPVSPGQVVIIGSSSTLALTQVPLSSTSDDRFAWDVECVEDPLGYEATLESGGLSILYSYLGSEARSRSAARNFYLRE